MEIIKNLSEEEISNLRDVFEAREDGLDVRGFESALTNACSNKATINMGQLRLKELFSEIDVSGDGFVNWDEFIMFIINRTDGRHKAASGTGLDGVIKNYLLSEVLWDDIPKTVVKMDYVPMMDKIIKVVRQERGGSSRIRVLQNDLRLTPYFDIPKQGDSQATSFTFIPPSGTRMHTDNTLAISYNDSFLRFFDMAKKRLTMHNETRMVKAVRLAESQTCLRWSTRYHRLVMGSRTGIISVIHPDEMQVYNQEKLHGLLISDMVLDDSLLFTASVDPVGSVKCVDLQRNVVRYALDDHLQGATMVAVNPSFQTLFSVGFELYIVSHAMLMPRVKAWKLIDTARPHRGRITQLHLVPNTPQLLSSDSCGLTKLWDIRMNSCIQNILPPKDELDITPPEQSAACSMCIVGPSKRIIINGRNTAIYCYEGAVDPSVADEVPAQLVLFNASTQTIMSFHQSTIKIWDMQSGELTATHKDINKDSHEISSALIVQPMERKLLIGTAGGGLFKLSCSLCDVETDLTPFVDAVPSCKGNEILSLQYIPTLRESSTAYILTAMRRQILLVPDAEAHGTKSAMDVPALSLPSNVLIKTTDVVRGAYVLVGCSDASVRVIDLNTMALSSVWSYPSMLCGDVITLSSMPLMGTNSGLIAFSAFGGGHVACGVSAVSGRWDTVEMWDGTEHCEVRMDPAMNTLLALSHASDGSTSPDGEVVLSKRVMPLDPLQGQRPSTTTDSRASSGLSRALPRPPPREAPHSQRSASLRPATDDHPPGTDSAVATYLNATSPAQRSRLMGSCVVVVHALPNLELLATADERGTVSLWDVRPCLKHCAMYATDPTAAPLASGPPHLIKWWRAHDEEITAMKIFQDPDHQLVFLVTASNDKTICLWSADGVLMGNLAIGREDNAAGSLPTGVRPFLFRQDNPPLEHWAEFSAYVEHRDVVASPLVAHHTRTIGGKHTPQGSGMTASGPLRIGVPPRAPIPAAISSSLPTLGGLVCSGASTPLPSSSCVEFPPIPIPGSAVGSAQDKGPLAPVETSGALGSGEPSQPTSQAAGGGATFFLTQDMVTLEPNHSTSNLFASSCTTGLARLQADRFGGVIKRSALGKTQLKVDQVPRHLSHTGPLCGTTSPRFFSRTATLPVMSPQEQARGFQITQTDDGDTTSLAPLPCSPRRTVSSDPPMPHRPVMSQQSQRILRQCVTRYEPKTAEEYLRRKGCITLRSPGSRKECGSVYDGVEDEDGRTQRSASPSHATQAPSVFSSSAPSTMLGCRVSSAALCSPKPPKTAPSQQLPGNSCEGFETPSCRSLKIQLNFK